MSLFSHVSQNLTKTESKKVQEKFNRKKKLLKAPNEVWKEKKQQLLKTELVDDRPGKKVYQVHPTNQLKA